MTIANAFNEITVAQGGTPNYSGTIASAIDALNDALAGSDQPAETTIEGAVRLLGQHIGGGGSLSPATADTLGGVKIGEGINVTDDGTISAAASGTYTFSLWNIDSGGNMATDGDYATARALLADGKPVLAVIYVLSFDQSYPYFSDPVILKPELTENSIKLWMFSSSGYTWDENGVAYFEV